MSRNRSYAVGILVFLVTATLGCSDSEKILSNDDFTEAELQTWMPVFADVLESLDPFAVSPLTGGSGVPECVEIEQDICDTGVVRECPPAKDGSIEVLIENCVDIDKGEDSLTLNGALIYRENQDWPEGWENAVLTIFDLEGWVELEMALDGTDLVRIVVHDEINDIDTNCWGSLVDPYDVVC